MLSSSDLNNKSSWNRTESDGNSRNKYSSISSYQSDSSNKHKRVWEGSEAKKSQTDSQHSIRPLNLNNESKSDINSEQKSSLSSLNKQK